MIITDLAVAIDYVNVPGSIFETVWVSPEPEIFGVCLKKGNDALTEAINKALEELFNNGTMQRISQDFFNEDLVTMARELW